MIRGLVYQLDIILVPEQSLRLTVPATNQSVVVSMLNKSLVQTFYEKTSGLLVQYYLTSFIYTQAVVTRTAADVYTVQHEVDRVRVSTNMTSTRSKERDEVEEALVSNLLLQDWTLFTTMKGETVNFKPSSVHRNLFGIRNNNSNARVYVHDHSDIIDSQSIWSSVHIPRELRIQPTRLLTCPSVEFGPTEFLIEPEENAEDHVNETESTGQEQDSSKTLLPLVIKDENIPGPVVLKKVTGQWRVALMGREVSLLHSQFSWEIRQDGSFVICLDTLEELLAKHRRRKVSGFSWQYALSMAAIPLSILCLLVLLVVYALLPELRTQPGLNTMGTCTTLLLAQLSLLLASHRVVSGAWCTAVGVFVHLSWLSTFCWTSVCSVHMYRAFSCKTDRRCGRVSYKVLAQSGAVTLLLPGAVVAVVVAVSWQQSGGRSIGYSSATCYLRSPLVVGLSVLLPLSVILAFNLLFYSLTVYRIHKVTTLQARAQSETVSGAQHVRACLRLSLLTGVTWLFSLLSESMDLDWLRAVSILANGGQGVLLLLSYVTTKRVTDMLMTRLGCGDDVTRGSSTVTEGLTERSNVMVRRSHASNADV
ncbi:cadherin EGF LAG seven-pass G-type receptor 2-like [Littorina saxatilis]|uniref:cadherin EGF LAG seven-pass G-type receptor 2-like n=1 Tax=Littorina saxatilis TaxID=31220 RepID=UPI0038B49629